MLSIFLPERRMFNERTEEFEFLPPLTLKLEHSLLAVRRWESKWHKSYLSSESMTMDENLDYIRCMSLDPNITPDTLKRLTMKDYESIRDYIQNPMTATTFRKEPNRRQKKEIVTCEIVYYMMAEYGIPFECEKWHLNQLLTLIHVCSIKGAPIGGKKKEEKDILAQMRALNASRRAKTGSRG